MQRPVTFNPSDAGIRTDQTFHDENLPDSVACPHCSTGTLRPGVVWFDKMLPQDAFRLTVDALQIADPVVVVGTSGLVQPAASIPFVGQEAGAKIIEINPVSTALSNTADIFLALTAAVAMPQLIDELLA